MNTPNNLEVRLRAQMQAKADELKLTPLEFSDVLARGGGPIRPVLPPAPSSRRGSTWMVAAALVAGAAIGAGAILVTRDDQPAATGQNVIPQQPGQDPSGVFASCSGDPLPPDLAAVDIANDIRIVDARLPVTTPAGYCVNDHRVASDPIGTAADLEVTVWSDCESCEQPSASVARLSQPFDLELSYESGEGFESIAVGGYDAHFYPANDEVPVGRLYVDTGADVPATFVGWGLDATEFAAFADGVIQRTDPSEDVNGMSEVFQGVLGQYWPGSTPVVSNLTVWYFSDDGESMMSYRVLVGPRPVALEAYTWIRPDAAFTTVDGQPMLAFPPSVARDGTEQTTVIRQIADTTTVFWSSTGTPPMTAEELAAIELTPAAPDDPRWLEIAYESGCSSCVG